MLESDCEFNAFKPKMREELEKLELYSLLGRLFGGKKNTSEKKPAKVPEKKEKETKPSEPSPQLDLFS